MDNKQTNIRLKEFYKNNVIGLMMKEFKFTNPHQVCRIDKIVLSKGINKKQDVKKSVEDLSNIACQKAITINAKKSVSQFSIREGQINGAKVTLRGDMMYRFLEKFINVYLVLNRDFKGINANTLNQQKQTITCSFGVTDDRLFPEVSATASLQRTGFNVNIVISGAKTLLEAAVFLNAMEVPIVGLDKLQQSSTGV